MLKLTISKKIIEAAGGLIHFIIYRGLGQQAYFYFGNNWSANQIYAQDMKFKIKNCPYCAYWSSLQRIEPKEFCVVHRDQEDQPPGIIKALKKVKKKRQKRRIINLIWTLFLVFSILYLLLALFGESEKSIIIIYSILLTVAMFCLPFEVWLSIKEEKETQEELKALQKKQSEWIIEYG